MFRNKASSRGSSSRTINQVIWDLGRTVDLLESRGYGQLPDGQTPQEFLAHLMTEVEWHKIPTDFEDYENCLKVPVLRPAGGENRYVDVILRFQNMSTKTNETKRYETTLRLKVDDLYLIGFKSGRNPNFWEFRGDDNKKGKLIPNSHEIPMNGSYVGTNSLGTSAVKWNSFSTVNERGKEVRDLEKLPYRNVLHLTRINTCLHLLDLDQYSRENSKDHHRVANSLMFMVQLLAEMCRFNGIQQFVANQWFGCPEDTADALPQKLINDQNYWSEISENIQKDEPNFDRAHELGVAKHLEGWPQPKKKAMMDKMEKILEKQRRKAGKK